MPTMKCHYEVLAVPRDAGADDLKKAYRKLALKWHPDKNLDNAEEATQQFRLVQQAYEVLTDPQERAFYDKHREAILRGGMGHGDKYEDDCLDVYQYYNSSCYKGFGDDKEGFYATYEEVFKTIAEEDRQFIEDEEDFHIYEFGNSSSVFEEVVKPFYDYWDTYCTAKSFVWVEKYDLREAPERRVRRLMEAENKKLRDAAKKERNEEVRALVKFVKKRDKRVQEYKKKLEERAAEIARKSKENRDRQLKQSKKLLENYKETEWSSTSGLEDHYKQLEASYATEFGDHEEALDSSEDQEGDEEEEEAYDDLFCVACNRAFKSEKAFINHEKSKKHKEFVAIIKAHMEEEEAEHRKTLGDDGSGEPEDPVEEDEIEEDTPGVNNEPQKLSKKQKKKRKQQRNLAQNGEVDDVAGNQIAGEMGTTAKGKSKRERRRAKQNEEFDEDSEDETAQQEEYIGNVTEDNSVDDLAERLSDTGLEDEKVTEKLDEEAVQNRLQEPDAAETEPSETDDGSKMDRKKSKNKKKPGPDPNQKPASCGICGADFPSRSKLFDHIKSTGHAMRKDVVIEQAQQQTQGKKNKKKKGK